ncbi:IclR family transcriptional regulator [Euzebya tangerina]|uniref:IclR family transcriptional regulator n=1 Tax=Euzebya tangerina TaxID=591198 RepID=UPI000E30EFA5|nr:IclR family transcriptional regulator [Euzebya tangerina]
MIQSIDRAAQVLQSLAGARRLGITEIGERLNLPPSTVHGIVKSLAMHGLVAKEPGGSWYMLGPALLRLSNVFLDTHEVRLRSLRWVDELSRRTGHAIRVGVELFDDVMVVHHATRSDGSQQMAETGISIPAHACAMGKVLMAYDVARVEADPADPGREAEPLRRLTNTTVTDPGELRAELDKVQQTGLAFEREESVIGDSGMAVPLVDRRDQVVAALAVVIPESQWPDRPQLDEVIDDLREAARGISRELGASRWPPPVDDGASG